MIESFIETLSGIADTISILIQYFIHTISHLKYFLGSLVHAVAFIFSAVTVLPVFFFPIITVVIGAMIIRAILGRE